MARHDGRLRSRVAILFALILPWCAAGCGEDSPTTPTDTTVTLTVRVLDAVQAGVSGAMVRITDGGNAGRNATTASNGSATLSGLSAGTFTIEVTASGYDTAKQSVTLEASKSVTVQLAVAANGAPVISSIVAKGSVSGAPVNYSDAGEALTVTAKVTDAETALANLTYQWTADSGTFSGTGATVSWQPATTGGSSGASAVLTLTVIENYGPANSLQNKVSSSVKVVVHDSRAESGFLCSLFLSEFSDSSIAASVATRNFSTSLCPAGAAAELADVTENRKLFKITGRAIGSPVVTLGFGGTCSWGKSGDACISMSCEWWSNRLSTDTLEHVAGTCHLTTVYDKSIDAWQLCWSNFDGVTLPSGKAVGDRWKF